LIVNIVGPVRDFLLVAEAALGSSSKARRSRCVNVRTPECLTGTQCSPASALVDSAKQVCALFVSAPAATPSQAHDRRLQNGVHVTCA
jgi:hypothetical protein